MSLHQRHTNFDRSPANPVINLKVLYELADFFSRRIRILGRESDHLHSNGVILLMQLYELRNFSPARSAPGCPEVNHQHLAEEVGQFERRALCILERCDPDFGWQLS